MARSRHGSKARRWLAGFTALVLILGATLIPATSVAAASPDNTVIAWNRYAVEALSNPLATATPPPAVPGAGLTPPVAAIHMAIVQGAVYDAVNAIDRGHTPYLAGLPRASRLASKAAAAATAAHHVLVGLTRGPTTTPLLPAGVRTRLDNLYNAKIRNIRASSAKRNGIRIGAAVAARMLANRASDGRYGTDTFTPGTGVGQWRFTPPDPATAPPPGNDPNGWVRSVRPFTLVRASQFRTAGPLAITNNVQYAVEYNEVKLKGAATGSTRTPTETEVAMFHSGNPLIMLHRGLRQIAAARGLSIVRQARLFAMASMSSADAAIGCWDSKWAWSFWRPITAIRDTADDGNAGTVRQDGWTPLRPNPPYPDEPSGYNCFAWSFMSAVKRYFATDRISFQLTSTLTLTTRSYTRVSTVLQESLDARVWNGLHFRTADNHAALLGQKVAGWVGTRYFKPVR
jgi:vanadium-dependent haloperoxidase-like protein